MQPNLSKAIRASTSFSLNVLNEDFQSPLDDEREYLPLPPTLPFTRHVLLKGNNIPVVFARVMIPETTYHNYSKELNQLGSLPIGEYFLYQQPHTRSAFDYKCLTDKHLLFQASHTYARDTSFQAYWARRSLFNLQKGQLVITEVFFPAIQSIRLASPQKNHEAADSIPLA